MGMFIHMMQSAWAGSCSMPLLLEDEPKSQFPYLFTTLVIAALGLGIGLRYFRFKNQSK